MTRETIGETKGGISTGLIIKLCVVAAVIFILSGLYGYYNSLRNTCVQKENELSAQYLSNQNLLSEFMSGFYEQIGIANLKSEKMDKIITDAISGRYGEDGFSANGAFFSAIKEAYPDVSGLNIYDKIVDYVRAKREAYRAIQDKLLSMLKAYQNWQQEGVTQSWIISSFIGAPTKRLQAHIGKDTLYGQAAFDKMFQIVLTQKAINAYKSGTMEPMMPPK